MTIPFLGSSSSSLADMWSCPGAFFGFSLFLIVFLISVGVNIRMSFLLTWIGSGMMSVTISIG